MSNLTIIPGTMCAVQLTGHGDISKLVYREDVPTPQPGPGEVLVEVTAAGRQQYRYQHADRLVFQIGDQRYQCRRRRRL